MRRIINRRMQIFAVTLLLVLSFSLAGQTAYARYKGAGTTAKSFHTTFVGTTSPVKDFENGPIEVELSGRLSFLRRANMDIVLLKRGSNIFLTDQAQCNGATGWCIDSPRGEAWVFAPLLGGENSGFDIDNTNLYWGAGILQKVHSESKASKGMATYRVMIDPPETDEEGLTVIVDFDGFVTFEKKARSKRFEDDDEEDGD